MAEHGTKTSAGNFFEDFRLDQEIVHATPRTITTGDVALYTGLFGSRFAVTSADAFAERLGLPRSPIDDVLVFHVVFGKTVPDISLNAVANLGYAGGRFGAPVYPGDTLSATSRVIGLKENSNGKTGVVYVRTTGRNQDAAFVLDYVRWVMVNKRDAARAGARGPGSRPAGRRRRRRPGGSRRPRSFRLRLRGRRQPPSVGRLRGRRAHRPCGRGDGRGVRPYDGDAPVSEHGAHSLQRPRGEGQPLRSPPHLRRSRHQRRPIAFLQWAGQRFPRRRHQRRPPHRPPSMRATQSTPGARSSRRWKSRGEPTSARFACARWRRRTIHAPIFQTRGATAKTTCPSSSTSITRS